MQVASDKVVLIHYTLKNDAGEVLDRSEHDSPLAYLHGRGNLIPGLERELEGKKSGDKLQVTIAPADAYGEYDKDMVQRVPRSAVQGVADLKKGMQLHARTDEGVQTLMVVEVDDNTVTLDGNHPLAGQTLHFEVEIADVRTATAGPPRRAPSPAVAASPPAYTIAMTANGAQAPTRARQSPAASGPIIFAICIETVSSEIACATRCAPRIA